ncbi:TPA: hypothetical protein ACX6NV_002021 [Photobacterium damselae]
MRNKPTLTKDHIRIMDSFGVTPSNRMKVFNEAIAVRGDDKTSLNYYIKLYLECAEKDEPEILKSLQSISH